MSYPEFIIIGAMKCGTSTLASQLGAQSGIFMTEPKEPNYFSDEKNWARGADWYGRLFMTAEEGTLRGEASTHYTKRPDYPETIKRMQSAVPDVRLVYMIRNPLERLLSHFIHAWSEGENSGDFDGALKNNNRLIDYGRYGWQITPYIEAFGSNAVLLTSLERLKLEPDAELSRIAKHIGYDGEVSWKSDLQQQNVSAQRIRKFPLHSLLIDNPVAERLRRGLVPKFVRDQIRAKRQFGDRPSIPDRSLPELHRIFSADQSQLAEFFPSDASLQLAYPFAT